MKVKLRGGSLSAPKILEESINPQEESRDIIVGIFNRFINIQEEYQKQKLLESKFGEYYYNIIRRRNG